MQKILIILSFCLICAGAEALCDENVPIEPSIVIVDAAYKGIDNDTGKERICHKTLNGFFVLKVNRVFLVTANHFLMFYDEDEKDAKLKIDRTLRSPFEIKVYSNNLKGSFVLDENYIRDYKKPSNRESSEEKADVAVIEVTNKLPSNFVAILFKYERVADRLKYAEINRTVNSGDDKALYYSYLKDDGEWGESPISREIRIKSGLGENIFLENDNNRLFRGFKFFDSQNIQRGDCGSPIVYQLDGVPYIIGLINPTSPIHPDITQDSTVIIDTIRQFEGQ